MQQVQKRIEEIREMALAVYDYFGSGYNESIYKEALMVELRDAHLPYDRERYVTVEYKNHVVGTGIADIVVLPLGLLPIPIECKKAELHQDHREQLRTHMKGMGGDCKHGILICFPQPGTHEPEQKQALEYFWARRDSDGRVLFYRRDSDGEWLIDSKKKKKRDTKSPPPEKPIPHSSSTVRGRQRTPSQG
jgi:GxxExxY protein